MPNRGKLTSIQWQYVKQWFALSVGTILLFFTGLYIGIHYFENHPAAAEWVSAQLEIPNVIHMNWKLFIVCLVLALLLAAIVGIISGYIVGNLLKKRMNVVRDAAMNLERGMLSYRVPELGSDELGEIGWQLNRLAAKWEEQVVSLQRLSNHNLELAEQVRYAAVVEERQRLARELHDAVSQQLFAISMTTAAIKRLITKNPERAAQQIELVEEMAAGAQAEMRALLLHLRPATLQDKSLKEAICELLDELTRKHPISLTWEIEDIPNVSSAIEDHLFRILQESLSNTLRHARASTISVKLFPLQDQVRMRIADDGIGFDTEGEKMTSYGLVSIRERINELGGALDIYSAIGKGTQIEVRIPIMSVRTVEEATGDD
ncbi:HAMP domain-containing sensor histidine kinase [Brevibacillus sp. SYSU BS000544]|uniref:HAMP domain-containing sensor histidine kinase n=1 Tax=Brevibacillus sp. SYSU BS000544 TaxID=3416443 RepID=UPI003CE597E9